MRRRWRTIVLFLAIGVAVNLVLAWMFALFGSIESDRTAQVVLWHGTPRQVHGLIPVTLEWPRQVPHEWPDPEERLHMKGRGMQFDRVQAVRFGDRGDEGYVVMRAAYGWPLPSMEWKASSHFDGSDYQTPPFGGRWITAPRWLEDFARSRSDGFPTWRRIPIEPLWKGFAVNSLMFACGIWMVLRSPRTARRWLRRSRGQCVACGYPQGSSPICTECGQPLADRPREGRAGDS